MRYALVRAELCMWRVTDRSGQNDTGTNPRRPSAPRALAPLLPIWLSGLLAAASERPDAFEHGLPGFAAAALEAVALDAQHLVEAL